MGSIIQDVRECDSKEETEEWTGEQGDLRRGRREKSKNKRLGGIRSNRRMQGKGVDISVPYTVRPYSNQNKVWGLGTRVRGARIHIAKDNTSIGVTGRPLDGNIGGNSTPIDTTGNATSSTRQINKSNTGVA